MNTEKPGSTGEGSTAFEITPLAGQKGLSHKGQKEEGKTIEASGNRGKP